MKTLFFSFLAFISMQCKQNETVSKNSTTENLQESVIKVVSANEFKKAINASNVQLVDVRTPDEFNGGHINGAININIYDKDFEEKILKFDQTKPIYVYCRSGARSQSASQKMKDLGFKEIFDLKGGFMAY